MQRVVEVRRASDTRARREVVAQMLDYAANGVATWQNDRRDAVAQTAGATDPGTYLQEQFGVEDVEKFWTTVEDNLRVGKIRRIFLADRLAPGLVRIIEFLNEQTRDVEVLGIELPQYTAPEGHVVYVPGVVGRTAAAVEAKQHQSERAPWTEQILLDAGAAARTAEEMTLVRRLIGDVKARGGRFSWGSGSTAAVTGRYLVDGKDTPVWNVNVGDATTAGWLYHLLSDYSTRHPERVVGRMPTPSNRFPSWPPKWRTAITWLARVALPAARPCSARRASHCANRGGHPLTTRGHGQDLG